MPDANNFFQQSEFAAKWQDEQEQGRTGPTRDSEIITPREALDIAPEPDLAYDYWADECPCMEFHNEGHCVCGESDAR